MRIKITVFLLILNFVTFGLLYYLNDRTIINSASHHGLSGIIGREVVNADRIELSGKDLEETRVLHRKGQVWSIVEPIQWPANHFAINRILNQLQFLKDEAAFSTEEMKRSGQTLDDYGLENPLLKLTISQESHSIELSIGSPTEIGNKVYLLGPNKKYIFVISKNIISGLIVDLNDLRTDQVFDIPVYEVEALDLQIRNPEVNEGGLMKVRIARVNGNWMLETPISAEADSELSVNVVNELSTIKAKRFLETEAVDPVLYGFDSPIMRVTLHGNKRRQTLLIGNRDTSASVPSYFAKLEDNPTTFTVLAKPFDGLQEAQNMLRQRNFMGFDPEVFTTIEISEKPLQIRLQKLETGIWQVIQSDDNTKIQPYRTDPQIVTDLISNLKVITATNFAADMPTPADRERFGFNSPRRIVKLTHEDGSEFILVLAHPISDNNNLYARTNSADYIYEVDRRSTLDILPLNALYYRNRSLESLPKAAKIKSIRLDKIDTDSILFDYDIDISSNTWPIALADLPESLKTATLTLIDNIRDFKVSKYILDEYTDSYHLDVDRKIPWIYRLSAVVILPGGDTPIEDTYSYVFTNRLSGTIQVGGSVAHNAVFQINQDMLNALYEITEPIQLPPEVKGKPIPIPKIIQPIDAINKMPIGKI